jgi:predicted metal-dependent phosphoesterase TrpH
MYIHLTTHSAYSLQEGLMTPADLAQAALANGMTAVGLTDHRMLTGAIEFASACKQAGIQPIIGLEINLVHGPLRLLATHLEAGRHRWNPGRYPVSRCLSAYKINSQFIHPITSNRSGRDGS